MTPRDVVIRRSVPDDALAVARFSTALFAEGLDTIPSLPATATTPEAQRGRLESIAATPNAFHLIALHGDEIVGDADFRPVEAARGRTAQGSFGMSVAYGWRGRGLGRLLLERLIQEALDDRPELMRIELEVVPWNTPAIRLYRSLGFEVEGCRRKALFRDSVPADILLMARLFR